MSIQVSKPQRSKIKEALIIHHWWDLNTKEDHMIGVHGHMIWQIKQPFSTAPSQRQSFYWHLPSSASIPHSCTWWSCPRKQRVFPERVERKRFSRFSRDVCCTACCWYLKFGEFLCLKFHGLLQTCGHFGGRNLQVALTEFAKFPAWGMGNN